MTANELPGNQRKGDRHVLVALLNGVRVGNVYQTAAGTLRFEYDESWRSESDAYPLSLSMPLAAASHGNDSISPFLWGLLPDNDRTLDQYGRLFGVSSGNAVALLSHIGADCAGAVQFAAPDRVNELEGRGSGKLTVDWLTDAEVARELRTVRNQGIPGTTSRTVGQFSLAGAQPKIALLEESGRWGRPTGRTPTNRILKPPSEHFRGFAENEHLCLELASGLGLGSVSSRVMRFDAEVAIVVERFDRQKRGRAYHRVHQEDVCQALGVMPTRKYENLGGPGIKEVITLLREASKNPSEDINRFVSANVLSWVIAATDAHAKNYALLHSAGSRTRLAPFYDIASYLPYTDQRLHRVKLSMRIGRTYLVRRVTRRDWGDLAKENGMSVRSVIEIVEQLLRQLAPVLETVAETAIRDGLDRKIIEPLADAIRERRDECEKTLCSG